MNKKRIIFKLTFLFFLLLADYAIAQLPANLPSIGLRAWYPLNGNASDGSGFNNNGIVGANVNFIPDRLGNGNAAANFRGSSQILLPPAGYTPFIGSFSISFWFRSSYLLREQPVNIDDNTYLGNINFAFNNTGAVFAFWNSGGSNNIITGNIGQHTDGFWHHMVFMRDDSIVKIYFDGLLSGSKKYKLPIGKNSGMSISSGSYSWVGDIDDLAIYDRALTASEISNLQDISNPPMKLLTPIETDAYPIGYQDTINWINKQSITKVKLEYSIDGGNSWHLIKDSLSSSLKKYIWTIPNFPGKKCIVKITDKNNSSQFSISDEFLISKYKWFNVLNNGPFTVRDGCGAVTFKDSMYLIGGWNPLDSVAYPNATTNEVWRSKDGANWSLISQGPWEGRHTFGAQVLNNKMWILGGDQLHFRWQKEVWNSNDGVNWNLISDTVPWGARMTHMTCAFNNKLWVMGGQKILGWSNYKDSVFNDVWNSSDGLNWTRVTPHAAWSPRAQIGGQVIFNNKMWILGGGTYNGIRKYYNDVWNSSDGINWTQVTASAPWAPRQYLDVAVYDSAIWVMEGYDGINGNRKDVWYSYDGQKWYQLLGTPWPPRHASSVFTHNESLWVVAGNLWNDVWRLDNVVCAPISSQPLNDTAIAGNSSSFSVIAGKINSSFQWQIDSSGVWQNLSNSTNISGVNANELNVITCPISWDKFKFRCIVQKNFCSDTSLVANLRVYQCLGINLQPQDTALAVGSTAIFSISSANQNTNFQWQSNSAGTWTNLTNNGDVEGVNKDTLQISNCSLGLNNIKYRCLINSEFCADTSSIANLTVYFCSPTTLTFNSDSVYTGDSALFVASSGNLNPNFQWQIDSIGVWQNLSDTLQFSGSLNDTLWINNCSMVNNQQRFRCLTKTIFCADTTSEATLYVSSNVGIKNFQSKSNLLHLHPVPADDYIEATVPNAMIGLSYEIYDIKGRMVSSAKIKTENFNLRTSTFSPGLYLFKVGINTTRIFEIKR